MVRPKSATHPSISKVDDRATTDAFDFLNPAIEALTVPWPLRAQRSRSRSPCAGLPVVDDGALDVQSIGAVHRVSEPIL
jgi:hypothetical protein